MTPEPPTARPGRRAAVAAVAVGLAVVATACGSSAPAATTTGLVTPPPISSTGCTYEINSTVPAGEPQGIKPDFPAFTPDPSAVTALQSIKDHGGTGVVDGFTLPTGTTLYAGPDSSAASVGTVASGNSILAAAPVLWSTGAGGEWLGFFLACGGQNLYWVSVDQVSRNTPSGGETLAATLAQLRTAVPYDRSGRASLLPIVIKDKQLMWTDPKVTTSVGRGLLLSTA